MVALFSVPVLLEAGWLVGGPDGVGGADLLKVAAFVGAHGGLGVERRLWRREVL